MMAGMLPVALFSIICMSLATQQGDEVVALQTQANAGARDLVFMHVPYNFGHTVEYVAATNKMYRNMLGMVKDGYTNMAKTTGIHTGMGGMAKNIALNHFRRKNAEIWGRMKEEINAVNAETGCPTYFAPQKYWDKGLAQQYFGNKTVFGMLRDPYERLVAMFRGNMKGYGGFGDEDRATCDVNSGVKKLLKSLISGERPFREDCTFVPQAEYFEGDFGIKLAIDNRLFPASMNLAFKEHGYDDFQIRTIDTFHVTDCKNVWAGDLDAETKQLVRQVYKKDFELLCEHFGYCAVEEDVCITGVQDMCPEKLFKWNFWKAKYERI